MITLHRLNIWPARMAAGVVVLALPACHNDSNAQESTTTTAVTAPALADTSVARASAGHPPLSDADIAGAIERHLLDERVLRAEHVKVVVTQGVASLSGSVASLSAQERAVRVAETIRGVRSVVDEMSVAPVVRSDRELEGDVTSALQHDIATRRYTIGVTAKDGTVLLSGKADSWQEKSVIDDVAKTVPALKALVNAMSVVYAAVHSESDIATDVRHRIANDVWLDGDSFVVEVNRHEATSAFPQHGMVVHLIGTVGSAAQKIRAAADGWVAGVDRVDAEGVFVDWFAQDDQRRLAEAPVRPDPQIAQAVRESFQLDPRLESSHAQVAVKNGEVVLSGKVDSPEARRAAAADAEDTIGVWRVRDELLVEATGKLSDAEVERAVKGLLAAELPSPYGKSIQVSSVSGRVTLKGAVLSGIERLDAVEEAESLPGVSEVEDDLTVTGPAGDLKARIEDRLFWDPRVEHELVTVAVAPDGAATLTGTVGVWSEIKAASADAVRGGATRVMNKLQLKSHPEVVAR
jgi:osmotically-inducible protein OsmY